MVLLERTEARKLQWTLTKLDWSRNTPLFLNRTKYMFTEFITSRGFKTKKGTKVHSGNSFPQGELLLLFFLSHIPSFQELSLEIRISVGAVSQKGSMHEHNIRSMKESHFLHVMAGPEVCMVEVMPIKHLSSEIRTLGWGETASYRDHVFALSQYEGKQLPTHAKIQLQNGGKRDS